MPDLWMPGAQKIDIGNHAPTDGGPAKAIAHITWDKNATAAEPADLVPFANLREYFGSNPTGRGMAPHILWDPFHGTFAQFLPANSRSLSLEDHSGGTRTNRAGSVVLQIEALFFPYCRVDGKVYAHLTDTPCKGWDSLHSWIHSWGVPDTWPMGHPSSFTSNRDESTWETHAGWYAHAQVPENAHTDPGTWPAFSVTVPPAPQIPEDTMPAPIDVWAYRNEAADSASVKATGKHIPDAYGYLVDSHALLGKLLAQEVAQNAAITALAQQLGKTAQDTATIVQAVQKAIADATVHVSVDVNDSTQTPAS